MIAQQTDALIQSLDRRLQIDRVLALDPLAAVSGKDGDAGSSHSSGPATSTETAQQTTLAARLPLGRIVVATIVDVPDEGHVVADVERWRVTMAWPRGAGVALRPGQDITLRVLAHQPMLLFQNVDASGDVLDDATAGATPTRWSAGAMALASRAVDATAGGPIPFTEPIIEIEISALQSEAGEADAAPAHAAAATPSAGSSATTDHIALDDVIVARSASAMDSVPLSATTPIVLQGPAWAGQPMELVVRRERADDELDNPVLDHWCGEIVIDLPLLGRVSGHLALSMQGLRIRLEGEDAATVASMSEATASLATALANADLRVQALSVGHPGARAATASIDARG